METMTMVLVGLVVAAFCYYVLPVIVKAVRAIKVVMTVAVVVALVAVWFGYINVSSLGIGYTYRYRS